MVTGYIDLSCSNVYGHEHKSTSGEVNDEGSPKVVDVLCGGGCPTEGTCKRHSNTKISLDLIE